MIKFTKQKIMLSFMGFILFSFYVSYFVLSSKAMTSTNAMSLQASTSYEHITTETVYQEVVMTPNVIIENPDILLETTPTSEDSSSTEISSEDSYSFLIEGLPLSEELQIYTFNLCKDYNAPEDFYYLILAVMERESCFDVNAISDLNSNGTRDYGICQINSKYHDYFSELYGITDFMDPKQNIYCCFRILFDYYQDYKNEPTYNQILMCYNMGEGGAIDLNKTGVYSTPYSRWIDSRLYDYINMTEYDGGAL